MKFYRDAQQFKHCTLSYMNDGNDPKSVNNDNICHSSENRTMLVQKVG